MSQTGSEILRASNGHRTQKPFLSYQGETGDANARGASLSCRISAALANNLTI
jgi:hypothetical protein